MTTEKKVFLIDDYHRSRERIRDLGEVFTPENCVSSMLSMFSKGQKNFWKREDISFFEPGCGHGNIVISILEKRLDALHEKAKFSKIKNPELYSISNTLNTLWAIDIDIKNVNHCRERVLAEFLGFIIQSTKNVLLEKYIDKHFDFFVHLLCSITWHIHENETLSCLGKESEASINASKTKSGEKWFSINGHKLIDFNLSWVEYYRNCDSTKLVPLEYKRAHRFLDSAIKGFTKGQSDFSFAKILIFAHRKKTTKLGLREKLTVKL